MADCAILTAESSAHMALICKRLMALPIQAPGVDVFVRRHKVRRTNAQNDRLQWLCRLHAGWFNRERLRLIEARALPNTWPMVDADAVRRQIFNPGYCGTDSSTKPSKEAMAEIMDRYEADLRNMGVEFPELEIWAA